ncbi:MAG: hypothetical protein ACTHLW_02195 [Verrucomicrobiota bacterium]
MSGFKANLRVRGRDVLADGEDDQMLRVLIQDVPLLDDGTGEAKGKLPVYARIEALAGVLESPREIISFYEPRTKREYQVIQFEETAANAVTWKWLCESSRDAL